MKTQEAQKQFTKWFKGKSLDYKLEVERQAYWMEAQHAKVNLENNLDKTVESMDKGTIDILLSGALAAGHVYPHEAQKLKEDAYHDIDMKIAWGKAYSLITPEGPEQAIKYLHGKQAPKDLTSQDIGELEKLVNAEWDMIQAEKAEELETMRTQVQGEIVQKYSTGNVKELRQLRADVLALKILPPVGQNSQLWWIDKIDTQIKTYLDATSKGKTDPNKQYSAKIYADMIRVIYDDSIDLPGKEEIILSNMGADAKGNPRLRAKEDIPTLLKLARGEKSFTVKTAFKAFDLALSNELISPQQFIDVTIEFNEAVESGKYTDDGLRQLAENELTELCDEWIDYKLEKTGGFLSRKEKPEAYIERHKPEERKVEKGSVKDFKAYFGSDPESTHTYDDGRKAYFYKNSWFMYFKGTWNKVNPKTNKYEPYSKTGPF